MSIRHSLNDFCCVPGIFPGPCIIFCIFVFSSHVRENSLGKGNFHIKICKKSTKYRRWKQLVPVSSGRRAERLDVSFVHVRRRFNILAQCARGVPWHSQIVPNVCHNVRSGKNFGFFLFSLESDRGTPKFFWATHRSGSVDLPPGPIYLTYEEKSITSPKNYSI